MRIRDILIVLVGLLSIGAARADFESYSSEYLEKGYLYLSPVPGAEYVSPKTTFFLIRFETASPFDLSNLSTFITVTGDSSGVHSGQTHIASDNQTVIFEADSTFSTDELVTVNLNPTVTAGSIDSFEYQFMISGTMPESAPASADMSQKTAAEEPDLESALASADSANASSDSTPAQTGTAGLMPNGVSVPSNFPHINITTNDNPDDGYIFIDNRTSGSNSYNVIFDNTGSPIWYTQTDDERRDMKVQPNGMLTMLARDGYMRFIGLDTNYNQVTEYRTVNGYNTDEHELIVLENGHYLLIGRRNETVDMRRFDPDGKSNANVRETVFQEFTPENELIFQWRAWDNYDITKIHGGPTQSSLLFPHMNAIHIDSDGHILLSCRHLSEVTKIDRDSGEMIWRLSGDNNQFTFVNDPLNGFEWQHAIRNVGPDRYLLFDNGNDHDPSVSRGVEYELDTNTMTATLVWEYRETPDRYAHYMGNTQRLPNGNTLINWVIGNYPKLTEVRPDGSKAFEMNWEGNFQAYRVWRSPWEGNAAKPYLIIEPQTENITLLFNKFGDPDTAYYNIYGGTSPEPTSVLDTSTITLKHLTNLQNGLRYYFRVTAVDVHGTESDFSNEESIVVDIIRQPGQPGENMVINGDFTQQKDSWIWELDGSASATWSIENDYSHFAVSAGGGSISDVQLRQAGMMLIQGEKYVFEFDAWSDLPRLFGAKACQDHSPWINYSGMAYSQLTPNPTHFKHVFTMQSPTDLDSRVVFNSGIYTDDVYIDNISLFMVTEADLNTNGLVDIDDLLILAQFWLQDEPSVDIAPDTPDGIINMLDFAAFADNWLNGL
jgi:hypothetical protein